MRKQACPSSLKMRTANNLLQKKQLSDELKNELMSALASVVEDKRDEVDFSDRRNAINLLRAEVIKSPNQHNIWLEKLPSLLSETEEDKLRSELMQTCLQMVKCKVKPLILGLASKWDKIKERNRNCDQKAPILDFVKFYCDI